LSGITHDLPSAPSSELSSIHFSSSVCIVAALFLL
jgi:hypothetical protein